ncbi:carboxymuconolactone decarboxylase family protein [Microbulbifer sp. JMSA004]|uniref:carboxymuconolactone decarboxylase family protein n=1 Tax=unclassified Microbulbifer TaxID=2619833 RepID=UPI002B2E23D9|nr:carboxymuconolactone decarboxylase family protein [Microbulbifer sp. MKSA007]
MSSIPLVEHPASDDVARVFAEIDDELGGIPSLFRVYAQHPGLLEANWYKFKTVMIHGCLSAQLKEAIGLAVSADNHCDYGIYHHSMSLQMLGVETDEVMRIRTDPKHVHFSEKEHALFDLARNANSAPDDHREHLIAAARKLGAGDDEILEALGVMEMVLGANHIAEVLSLAPTRVPHKK